ncbi:murein biosynthesis integral membrane protein MurJ [Leptolyngbya sp. FACHB-711]|uniref:murein biosynthesis integral membrane protein MurJ n=1 Tax=unclassified Leptolyngbya TaxID=2650499 RepID=UPI001687C0CD|nr:murein biosynthesis integral membrane protein MurJ [Leptolyngbya sp. FACHB-711]MBD1848919.1 murein biosynthesis integral membrane protein MurJ [Cyanobacteria bacterium FACHB-502]MBD2026617.1 murein biosynthesis integral membrane protein MurJ [Leptolyngbya sp. FACHB-711]
MFLPIDTVPDAKKTADPKKTRSLMTIAGIVAVATLLSKIFGLVRQQGIAAAFGVGPAYGAYNFAYVIPGFLLILLGGINGPFHSAMVSVLAKRKQEEVAPIIETITTLVVGVLLIVTIALIVFAEPMMRLVAPGLYISAAEAQAQGISVATYATLEQTRAIAIEQFRIMAPMAVLAGLIGIGFGVLNAADQYWLPSVSPLFSSVTVLIGLIGLALTLGERMTQPEYAAIGGAVLAWSTLAGAVLQWLIQLPAQWRSGLGGFRLRFEFQRPEVQEVIRIMGPATFSSGMLQINVWTDLFFASFIPNAAAAVSAMGYAGLLIQTPIGVLSNVILVPLLPVFSRLAAPEHWDELKDRIRQGLLMTAITMLPLSALTIALAVPICRVIYERFAFKEEDARLTATVLIAYAVGMFVYLGRDVLVRVFYALEDADTPFRISIVNIVINAVLDFLLVKPFGAPGIILATVGVNLISTVAMIVVLNRRLNGLPIAQWSQPFVGLAIGSVIAGFAAWGTRYGLEQVLGTDSFGVLLLQVCLAGLAGLVVFGLFAVQMRLPEVNQLVDRLLRRSRTRT